MSLGRNFSDPSSLNENIPSALKLNGLTLLGFDVLGNPQGLNGFGGGLRFDNFSKNKKDASDVYSFNAAILTALLNYRLTNAGTYYGPILGIGMAHNSELESKINNSASTTYTAQKNMSYSLGAEGGWHVGHLALGGEIGYMSLKAKNFKSESDSYLTNSSNGNLKSANFSGIYYRFQIGMRF
jgi:hypothetical protein